jgi:hypothetical protein
MGISKRNPRGNLNWQSRYLKRKAICCGQLNEPLACDNIEPVITMLTSPYICKSKTAPTNFTISFTNTGVPSQATNTFFEWEKGGAGGPVVYSSYGPVSSLILTPAQQVTTTYNIVATNEWGCRTETLFTIRAFNRPEFSAIPTSPTTPCVPGIPVNTSNGSILVNNINPEPLAVYYRYNIKYGPTSPNPTYTTTVQTAAVSYNWNTLCSGDYVISIDLYVTIKGVDTLVCIGNTQTVIVP